MRIVSKQIFCLKFCDITCCYKTFDFSCMKFENPNLSPEAVRVRPQCVMVRYCVVPMGRLKWNLGCVIGMGKENFRLKSNDFFDHTIMQILHSTHSLLNHFKNRILGKD